MTPAATDRLPIGLPAEELVVLDASGNRMVIPASQVGGTVGPQGNPGPQGALGRQGPAGPSGPPGPHGSAGTGVVIRGSVAAVADLPMIANVGDAFLIAPDLWVYSVSGWQNMGPIQGPAGPPGVRGAQGVQGVAGIHGIQGVAGIQGTQGIPGPIGVEGPTGPGLVVKGNVPTVGDLPLTGNTAGDVYFVGSDMYVWDGASWIAAGNVQGPAGPVGGPGPAGPVGPAGPPVTLTFSPGSDPALTGSIAGGVLTLHLQTAKIVAVAG